MKARVLTQKSQSLFSAMGGWRTVAEIFASRVAGGTGQGINFYLPDIVRNVGAALVMTPFYLAGQVVALGVAATLLGTPAIAVCVYVSWRILRATT
jgi:hypothetical protein